MNTATEHHDNYRVDRDAEARFRSFSRMERNARSLSDFLAIAMLRGYTREWAETKYALRREGRA